MKMNNKKENFKRVAEKRTNKIIEMIQLLGNLANSSFYEYTDEQIEHIFSSIQEELIPNMTSLNQKKNKKGSLNYDK